MEKINPITKILVEFISLIPERDSSSLATTARVLLQHGWLKPTAHLGGEQQNLKQSIQNNLDEHGGSITHEAAHKVTNEISEGLKKEVENRDKQANYLFILSAVFPFIGGLLPLGYLWEMPSNVKLLSIWVITCLAVEGVLFYAFHNKRIELAHMKTELLRLKLLEARLQVAQKVDSPELRTFLYQAIAQNLADDQKTAAQMVVHYWGNFFNNKGDVFNNNTNSTIINRSDNTTF